MILNDSIEQKIAPHRVALLGTYTPRQCGIGTFTHDLAQSLAQYAGTPLAEGDMVRVLAMNNAGHTYNYSNEVVFELRDQQVADYRETADFLNYSPVDLLCVQHEYGIFGGPDGNYLLKLLRRINKPVVTTLHTVLRQPTKGQLRTLQEICDRSTRVIVMAEKARTLLQEIYGVPAEKIAFIPHGVPDVPFLDAEFYKDKLGVEGRRVLLTFGLLSPGKGIEVAIEAVAKLVEDYPDLAYIVLGATHPEVIRHEGEAYRERLKQRAIELGIERNVIFHNRYTTLEELCEYLQAADLYITPYWDTEQIVSGTLSYALGSGKAIVSTPSHYAQELLADGRGVLTPVGDAEAMAESLRALLQDDVGRNQMRKRAYMHGRGMIWSEVAAAYNQIFHESIEHYSDYRTSSMLRSLPHSLAALPQVKLDHLRVMTDDTGIIQHAVFATPDRFHGYCIDDNARALIATVQHWRLAQDTSILPLMHTYLSFVHHAYNDEHGAFRNFMSYERTWLEKEGSQDSQGRTIWALGTTVAFAPNSSILGLASTLFNKSLLIAEKLTSPRAQAFALLGIHAYLRRFSGATLVRRLRERIANELYAHFDHHATPDWQWLEDKATYCNARIPQALLMSGQWLGNQGMVDQGLRSLEWLFSRQTHESEGHLCLIGNAGWLTTHGCARFDQQPVDAGALLEAACDAYMLTHDERWLARAEQSLNWFLGQNDMHLPLADPETGGCYDGLHSTGRNANQGAESTLAWLMGLQAIHLLQQEQTIQTAPAELFVEGKREERRINTGD